LRGFYFLEKWRQQSGFSIPDDLVAEVAELVSKQMTDKGIVLKRYNLVDNGSYNPTDDAKWAMGDVSEIDVMKGVSFEGKVCRPMAEIWNEVKASSIEPASM